MLLYITLKIFRQKFNHPIIYGSSVLENEKVENF